MTRYALDGLFIAVALWLAGIFVYLLAEFSAMTEPEEFGAHVLIFGGALGIISQAGLLFLPWARPGGTSGKGLVSASDGASGPGPRGHVRRGAHAAISA